MTSRSVPDPRLALLRRASQEALESSRTMLRLILFYSIWLCTSILAMWVGNEENVLWVGFLMEAIDAVFTFAWLGWMARDVTKLYANMRFGWRKIAVPLLLAYPIAGILHGFAVFLNRVFSVPVDHSADHYFDAGYGWLVVILTICIQPAVVEELAFRGIFQTTLTRMMRAPEAILVTAAAFSIMHFNLVIFVPFVLLGAYLGWLRHWSDSLYPSMLAHFAHNLLVTLDDRFSIFPF